MTPLLLLLLLLPPILATPTFILIGGGTSGCLLASRLCTRLPHASILLLERAPPRTPPEDFVVNSPRNVFAAWFSPSVADIFTSLPDAGLNGRASTLVDGKTLGGASAINGLQWVAGANDDAVGLDGLDVARLEREIFDAVGFAEPPTSRRHIYTEEFLTAAQNAGFEVGGDAFEAEMQNVWVNRLAVGEDDRRVDSCKAFLAPVRAQCGNLQLVQGALVTRLLMHGKKVVGVEYVRDGVTYHAYATEEVILTAGPYSSPKILQLSGIGPRDVLEAAGIPVVADLPVGARTQGRVAVAWNSIYDAPLEPANDPALLNDAARVQWENGGGGVYATAISTVNGQQGGDAYTATSFVGFLPGDVGKRIMGSYCFANPREFGYLRVRSGNVTEGVEVKLNLLSGEGEVEGIVRCLERLADVHGSVGGFNVTDVVGREEIGEEYVRRNAFFVYHFVGGCARGSVVDHKWRVRGVGNLRVVDASVIREMPVSAGTLRVTYVLALAASEELVREYTGRYGH